MTVICEHELIYICGILRGIFFAGSYMTVTCEVDIAVSCVLAHISKNVCVTGRNRWSNALFPFNISELIWGFPSILLHLVGILRQFQGL